MKWCNNELEISDNEYFQQIRRERNNLLLTKRSVITNKLDNDIIRIKEYGLPYFVDKNNKLVKNNNGLKLASLLENYHSKLEIEQREHVAQILKYNKLYYKYFKTINKELKKYKKLDSTNAIRQIEYIINSFKQDAEEHKQTMNNLLDDGIHPDKYRNRILKQRKSMIEMKKLDKSSITESIKDDDIIEESSGYDTSDSEEYQIEYQYSRLMAKKSIIL